MCAGSRHYNTVGGEPAVMRVFLQISSEETKHGAMIAKKHAHAVLGTKKYFF